MTNYPQEFTVGRLKGVEVFKEAWEIIKTDYWTLFAITIVGMLIAGIIPVVILGPMICGIYLCFFDKIDGRPVDFGRLFKGFDYFGASLIVAIIIFIPIIVFIFAIYVPMILSVIAASNSHMNEGELIAMMAGMFAFELVLAVVMVIIHSFLIFSFQLVVDRKMPGLAAVKLSARAAWANKGGIASLIAVSFVAVMVGYAAICIGVYFVIPVIMMANAVAYRRVFPKAGDAPFAPPPPTAYSNM